MAKQLRVDRRAAPNRLSPFAPGNPLPQQKNTALILAKERPTFATYAGVGERFDFRVQLHQVLDVWRLVAYLSWGSVSEIPFHETLFSLKITIYPERSLEHAGVTLIGHGRHLLALAVTAVQNPGQKQNVMLKQVSCVECI